MYAVEEHPSLVGSSPQTLTNYRKGRYRGDDFCLAVEEFAARDRACIFDTYALLERLFAVLKQHGANGSDDALAQIRHCIDGDEMQGLLGQIQGFGAATLAAREDELMVKTIHDLRGGALSALLGQVQFAQYRPINETDARRLFFLTRDHLKIMRNALLGLDDPKRQADLTPKMHSVDLIAEKWQHALVHGAERQTLLEVDCNYHGNIAECCVEFGALDRVLYNLVNNACRHTASSEVKLLIRSHPDERAEPDDLLFCVSNPVSAGDEQILAARGDLNKLFSPGESSTGSGYGLTVAIDFVTNAFGLKARSQALEGGYLGAQLVAGEFRVWFHWPVAADV